MAADLVIRGIDTLLTMDARSGLGTRRGAALAVEDGRVAWIGDDGAAPPGRRVIDARGAVVLPGLVDCHTHAAWAGSRAAEWEARLGGAEYSAILEAGGGILSTVRATREASEAHLVALTHARLVRMRARGVTTVEVKSGYGLSPEHELKQLRAAREAGALADVGVVLTWLGAHTVPAEHRADRARYLAQLVEEQLPAVVGLAAFADVYVDRGAFTVAEARAILTAAAAAGLTPRVHAEQVTHTGAAALAASLGAASADHLERLDEAGARAMAVAGTVAVLLPGAQLTLRDPPPPLALLRAHGVPIAVATDLNPGTSAFHDLWTCASLACLIQGLTPEEALRGVTVEAARALRLPDRGRIAVGLPADLVVAHAAPGEPPEPASLLQHVGGVTVRHALREGR